MSGAAPIVVGVLLDRPGIPGPMIDGMRGVVDAAVATGRIDRPVTLRRRIDRWTTRRVLRPT